MTIRVFTKKLKDAYFTDYQKLRRYSQRIARMPETSSLRYFRISE